MNLVGWLFIAALVVVGGLVAYWGDQIGRHFGKKRLTFKRLRPRHTAAIITGLFGALATSLAIAGLFLFSEPVRVWIVEGNAARERLAQVERTLGKAEDELGQRSRELDSTRKSLASERVNLDRQKALVTKSQSDLASLRSQSSRLRRETAALSKNLRTVVTNLRRLSGEYRKLLADFDSTKVNNQQFQKVNKEISDQNLILADELLAAERRLKELETSARQLETDIATLSTQLDSTTQAARTDIERLNKEKASAQAELNQAKGDLTEAQQQVAALRQFRDSATAASRTRRLVFQRGYELARLPVSQGMSLAEARASMLALVERASAYARSQGAGDGRPEAAGFVDLSDPQGNPVPAAMQFDAFVERAAGRREPQVLIAAALLNAFEGEFVPLAVTVRPNPRVYGRGQVISEARIDSRKPEDVILAELSKFVQEQLGPKAIRDGLIPATGRPEPLGEISSEAVLALVRQIKASGMIARVQFIAAEDTRAADRLKLQFRLR